MSPITKIQAIMSLKPNAQWSMVGDELIWHDEEQEVPSNEEIENELSRLQSEYDKNEYARKREAEYPPVAEQLDYIYHHGIDAWKHDIIDPIKEKHPKVDEA